MHGHHWLGSSARIMLSLDNPKTRLLMQKHLMPTLFATQSMHSRLRGRLHLRCGCFHLNISHILLIIVLFLEISYGTCFTPHQCGGGPLWTLLVAKIIGTVGLAMHNYKTLKFDGDRSLLWLNETRRNGCSRSQLVPALSDCFRFHRGKCFLA